MQLSNIFILQECPEYIESKFVSYVIFLLFEVGGGNPPSPPLGEKIVKILNELWKVFENDKQLFLGP